MVGSPYVAHGGRQIAWCDAKDVYVVSGEYLGEIVDGDNVFN